MLRLRANGCGLTLFALCLWLDSFSCQLAFLFDLLANGGGPEQRESRLWGMEIAIAIAAPRTSGSQNPGALAWGFADL